MRRRAAARRACHQSAPKGRFIIARGDRREPREMEIKNPSPAGASDRPGFGRPCEASCHYGSTGTYGSTVVEARDRSTGTCSLVHCRQRLPRSPMDFAAGRLLGTIRSTQRVAFEAQLLDARDSVRSVTTSRVTFLEERTRETLGNLSGSQQLGPTGAEAPPAGVTIERARRAGHTVEQAAEVPNQGHPIRCLHA